MKTIIGLSKIARLFGIILLLICFGQSFNPNIDDNFNNFLIGFQIAIALLAFYQIGKYYQDMENKEN